MHIRVYYEDTDCGGIVYYANYLKFCERARSELFFQKGLSPHNNDEFFVVKNVNADYSIDRGSHAMIIFQAKEINAIIETELNSALQ